MRQREVGDFSEKCLACHKVESCGLFPKRGRSLAGKCVDCHLPNQTSNVIFSTHDGVRIRPKVRNHWIKVYRNRSSRLRRCILCNLWIYRFSFAALSPISLHTELRDLPDQSERNSLIQRKLHRTLRSLITTQLFLKLFDRFRSRIKSDVVLVTTEVDQVTIQDKRRNPILDCLFSSRAPPF